MANLEGKDSLLYYGSDCTEISDTEGVDRLREQFHGDLLIQEGIKIWMLEELDKSDACSEQNSPRSNSLGSSSMTHLCFSPCKEKKPMLSP